MQTREDEAKITAVRPQPPIFLSASRNTSNNLQSSIISNSTTPSGPRPSSTSYIPGAFSTPASLSTSSGLGIPSHHMSQISIAENDKIATNTLSFWLRISGDALQHG